MSLLDFYLYFDEDHDLSDDQMTEVTPVEAAHVIELVDRGHLADGEIFSHKGWYHKMERDNGEWYGSMWDGPTGEERRYVPEWNEWGN